MNDIEDLMVHVDPTTIDDMIEKLSSDQTGIFDKVKTIIESQKTVGSSGDADILRLFVSGCGGTGKSYLIKTIRAWVQAMTAPTGIASRNINGLTIHGMLALPVEHGSTPSYRPLSDDALKIVREKLHNVTLLIIDEVSIVGNVTLLYMHLRLLYMHLRLQEIFQTDDAENGWFGKRNLLVSEKEIY